MVTQQGPLLTDTERAQLPELFGNNYLKELKKETALNGQRLGGCSVVNKYCTVECVDTQQETTSAKNILM